VRHVDVAATVDGSRLVVGDQRDEIPLTDLSGEPIPEDVADAARDAVNGILEDSVAIQSGGISAGFPRQREYLEQAGESVRPGDLVPAASRVDDPKFSSPTPADETIVDRDLLVAVRILFIDQSPDGARHLDANR
jgi:hypothetical protein